MIWPVFRPISPLASHFSSRRSTMPQDAPLPRMLQSPFHALARALQAVSGSMQVCSAALVKIPKRRFLAIAHSYLLPTGEGRVRGHGEGGLP
jgi:hypothetical protein